MDDFLQEGLILFTKKDGIHLKKSSGEIAKQQLKIYNKKSH